MEILVEPLSCVRIALPAVAGSHLSLHVTGSFGYLFWVCAPTRYCGVGHDAATGRSIMNVYLRKIICWTSICLPAAHPASTQTSVVKPQNTATDYGRLPLSFEANQGQTDSRVKFLSRGQGYSLFLTQKEAVLALKKQGKGVSPGTGSASW